MFCWYCLAYICNHFSDATSISFDDSELEEDVWFTRGWTLQELAPTWMKFDGRSLLTWTITRITTYSRRRCCASQTFRLMIFVIFTLGRIASARECRGRRGQQHVLKISTALSSVSLTSICPSRTGRELGIPSIDGGHQSPACYHFIGVKRFPDETTESVHGDTTFTLSHKGLQLCIMVRRSRTQGKCVWEGRLQVYHQAELHFHPSTFSRPITSTSKERNVQLAS